MKDLKMYLSLNNLNDFNNHFFKDKFFDIFCQELYEIGPNFREILNVKQLFADEGFQYNIEFKKSDAIAAYFIVYFDEESITVKLNDEIIKIEPSVPNFETFIKKLKNNNIIMFEGLNENRYYYIKSSLIYTTNGGQAVNRSLGEAIKKWNDSLKA